MKEEENDSVLPMDYEECIRDLINVMYKELKYMQRYANNGIRIIENLKRRIKYLDTSK